MTTAEAILAVRHQDGGDIDPMEAEDAALAVGYAKAREFSDALGYDGDSYADYLAAHDRELAARGYAPVPWPLSLQGNDGD